MAGQLPSSPGSPVWRQNTFGALGTSLTGFEQLLCGLSARALESWGPGVGADTRGFFSPDAQIYVTNERVRFCWALGASEPVLYKQIKIPNSSGTC